MRVDFDPPSDPESTAHPCRNCDQEMTRDLDGEWICGNKDCSYSPYYEDFITKAHKETTEWAKELLARDPSSWVILDTETTGLGEHDQIVQVSVIDGAGNVLVENALIHPTIPIPEAARYIHGISDETVKDAPPFQEVLPKIQAAIDGKFLVIYNADYDLRMLAQSGDECGCPTVLSFSDYDCAMEHYAEWVGEWNDYHGSFRWQRLPGGDHTSLGDCRATLAVIRKMAEG